MVSDNIELKPIGKSAPPKHPQSSLSSAYKMAEEKAKATVHLQEGSFDAISLWALGSTAWQVICIRLSTGLHSYPFHY
jgi:hypothetical protein